MMHKTRRPYFRLKTISATILVGAVISLLSVPGASAGVPLTDLVLYGKVYHPDGTQIRGPLDGIKIGVFVDELGTPDTTAVLAETDQLFKGDSEEAELYVLRIKRLDNLGELDHLPTDDFVLEDDTLRVYVDWDQDGVYQADEEVNETGTGDQLVSGGLSDVRLLNLNDSTRDVDSDGLPDAWELANLGGTAQGPGDDGNQDGVSNFLAYALGLDPGEQNSGKMPFLQIEEDGSLVFFFRESVSPTGLSYSVQESTAQTLLPGSWQTVTGASIEEDSVDGGSKILKATIPGGITQQKRLFRLHIINQ
ncbi:MAG: hypothetical protein MK183_12800 [Verrucomicrobiales bacterium]|nr:hypothetical protein [Verrucomicrobiales bacterium]